LGCQPFSIVISAVSKLDVIKHKLAGSKEEEAVEAVDEINDVDVCRAVVGMDSVSFRNWR
jgi:hypothetical protein